MAAKKKLRGTIEPRENKDGTTSYRARVPVNGERLTSKWMDSEIAAVQAQIEMNERGARTGEAIPLAEAWTAWLALAQEGVERNRSGNRYKPSVLRSYEGVMRRYVLANMGKTPIGEIDVPLLTKLIDRLKRQGLGASTIRNALIPIRCVCGRAVREGDLAINGTLGVRLPAVKGKRDTVLTAEQVKLYIAATPEQDRAIWVTALHSGLRRGEIAALRWCDINLEAGTLEVTGSYDWPTAERVEPKSAAGRRTVPITPTLREHLARTGLDGRTGKDLVFGVSPTTAFVPSAVVQRAQRAFKAAGLEPLTMHGCRHAFASLAIAAGMEPKMLQTALGHSSITITMDRYAHLLPGSHDVAAAVLTEAFA